MAAVLKLPRQINPQLKKELPKLLNYLMYSSLSKIIFSYKKTQQLNRQASNLSETTLQKKLSVTSGAFGAFDTEPKKEPLQVQVPEKTAPSKQGSIELEPEKKTNLLTPADFHTTLTTK